MLGFTNSQIISMTDPISHCCVNGCRESVVDSLSQVGGLDWSCDVQTPLLFPLSEVLPATSHHPATQDLVGADPGGHKWATMGMAPS